MKIAAVFPGQGSQSVGMMQELHEQYDCVKETFSEASDVLGYDIWSLVQEGPEEKIKQTEFTQPVMFVSGMAVWRAWLAAGGQTPEFMAGHSLGEYVALTAAGVFQYSEALQLVAERGQMMAGAVEPGVGGMAAVLGLEDGIITELCESLNGERVVQAVNFNSPGQVVISGHLDAVEKACALAKEKGAKRAMVLPVSVPNHSRLMDSAAEPLAAKISAMHVSAPKVPVVQNLEACVYDTPDEMINALKKHVCNPVYWTGSVRYMREQGVEAVIEMGPGKVLTGLNKRIDRSIAGSFVQDIASMEKSLELVKG